MKAAKKKPIDLTPKADVPESDSDALESAKRALQADAQKRAEAFAAAYQKLCEEHRCAMQPALTMSPAGVHWALQPMPQA